MDIDNLDQYIVVEDNSEFLKDKDFDTFIGGSSNKKIEQDKKSDSLSIAAFIISNKKDKKTSENKENKENKETNFSIIDFIKINETNKKNNNTKTLKGGVETEFYNNYKDLIKSLIE